MAVELSTASAAACFTCRDDWFRVVGSRLLEGRKSILDCRLSTLLGIIMEMYYKNLDIRTCLTFFTGSSSMRTAFRRTLEPHDFVSRCVIHSRRRLIKHGAKHSEYTFPGQACIVRQCNRLDLQSGLADDQISSARWLTACFG